MGMKPDRRSVLEPDPNHDTSATGPGFGLEREEDDHPHPLQSHPVHVPRSQHLEFQTALGYSPPPPPESKDRRRSGSSSSSHYYVPGPVYGGLPPIFVPHDDRLSSLSPTDSAHPDSSSSSNSSGESQESPSSLPSLSPPASPTESTTTVTATASPSSDYDSTQSPASPTLAEEKPLLRKRRSIFFFGAGARKDLPLSMPLSLSQPRSLSRRQSIGDRLRSSVAGIAGRHLSSRRDGTSGVDESL